MRIITLVLVSLTIFAAVAVAAPHSTYDLTLPAIELRPGVTVDLHAAVFVNESHPCNGNVALAIHELPGLGFGRTGLN